MKSGALNVNNYLILTNNFSDSKMLSHDRKMRENVCRSYENLCTSSAYVSCLARMFCWKSIHQTEFLQYNGSLLWIYSKIFFFFHLKQFFSLSSSMPKEIQYEFCWYHILSVSCAVTGSSTQFMKVSRLILNGMLSRAMPPNRFKLIFHWKNRNYLAIQWVWVAAQWLACILVFYILTSQAVAVCEEIFSIHLQPRTSCTGPIEKNTTNLLI